MVKDSENSSPIKPLDEESRPDLKQPAADLLPVLYAELRRLAAALDGPAAPRPDAPADGLGPRSVSPPGAGQGSRLGRPTPFFWRGRAGDARDPDRTGPPQGESQTRRAGTARRAGRRVWPGSNRRAAICSPSTRRSSSSTRKTRIWRKSSSSAITPGSPSRKRPSVIGVSVSTLKRDWRYARAWLARRLGEDAP